MNYQGIVERIIDLASDDLNDWEAGFLSSIVDKNDYSKLTEKQQLMIRNIQDKYLKY